MTPLPFASLGQTTMRRTCALALILVAAATWPARSDELVFDFTGFSGALDGTAGTPFFGNVVPAFTPVSGVLTVDESSAATHPFAANQVGYRQEIPDGISLVVGLADGDLEVTASDYLVILSNDVPFGPFTSDRVEFVFSDVFVPALSNPLHVNGNPVTTIDYNRDGFVDNLDFGVWASEFGATLSDADGNSDMIVNAADYALWRDGRGALLGLLSIQFVSFNDPFDSTDLLSADLASTLTLGHDSFVSMFNRVGDSPGGLPFDYTFDLLTLLPPPGSVVTGGPAQVAVPEPSALGFGVVILFWSVVGRRRAA